MVDIKKYINIKREWIVLFLVEVYLLLNIFLFFKDNGGLDGGYIAWQYYSFLLLVPGIFYTLKRGVYLHNLLFPIILLSILVIIRSQSILNNYIVATAGLILMMGFFVAGTIIKEFGCKINLNLFFISLFFINFYYGIKNFSKDILIGEDRLWRSLPWHNPSGLISIITLFYFLSIISSKEKGRLLYLPLAGISLSTLYLSGSRGSILITVFLLVILLIQKIKDKEAFKRYNLITFLLIFIISIIGIFGINAVKGEYSTQGSSYNGLGDTEVKRDIFNRSQPALGNFSERVKYWRTGLKIFLDRPILGTGIGTWNSVQWLYRSHNETLSTAAHNDYIQLLSEGGLVLSIPIFLLIFLYLTSLRRNDKIKFELKLLGIGFILHSFIDFNTRYPINWSIFMLILGYSLKNNFKINVLKEKYLGNGTLLLSISIYIILLLQLLPNTLVMDEYYRAVRDNKKVSAFNYKTAINNEIVLYNTDKLISKRLDFMAIDELKMGEIYNPGDIRLKIFREQLEYMVGKVNVPNFENTEKSLEPYFWNTGELNGVYTYSRLGYGDKMLKRLEEIENKMQNHKGWEFNSTMNWVYVYFYLHERNFGGGCESERAEEIYRKFLIITNSSELEIKRQSIPYFNLICENDIDIKVL